MSAEQTLLAIIAVENVVIGFLFSDMYRRLCDRLDGHDADIRELDKAREKHEIKLAVLKPSH